jgi:hypothetical protein
MPTPDIDAEYVRRCLDYDPDTGIFRWRVRDDVPRRWNTRYAGRVAGYLNADGYRVIIIGNHSWMAARLAWIWMHGSWPEFEIRYSARDDVRIAGLKSLPREGWRRGYLQMSEA